MQRLACGTHLRLLGPWAWDGLPFGPANGTGVRPGPVPSSPSPGLTQGTQLQLSARQQWQQWRLRNLLKIPPEKSNGMGGDRTRNLSATSQSP